MVSFIENGQVFVNGKLITSNGYEPKEGDIISVRGKGRFRFDAISGHTKKGQNKRQITTISVTKEDYYESRRITGKTHRRFLLSDLFRR